MTPTDTLRLVMRLLRAAPTRTVGLVLGLAATAFLPAVLATAGVLAFHRVEARLAGAPIVVLAPGDPALGTWSALTGAGAPDQHLPLSVSTWPGSLPLRAGRTVDSLPLVGVDGAWTTAWGLALAKGREAVLPGEVVVGAGAAAHLKVQPGDTLQADPLSVVHLDPPPGPALAVVGTLAPTLSPEHHWVLTPLSTTWMLDGTLHGDPEALHLHGSAGEQPISAVVIRPPTPEARDLLLVELDGRKDLQGVEPRTLLSARLRPFRALLSPALFLGALVLGALLVLLRSQILQHAAARAEVVGLLVSLGASERDLLQLRATEAAVLLGAAVLVALVGTLGGLAGLGQWL